MSATPDQIKATAEVIANKAQAIVDGKIPDGELYAQVSGIHYSAELLKAWVPQPEGRKQS